MSPKKGSEMIMQILMVKRLSGSGKGRKIALTGRKLLQKGAVEK